MAQRRLRLYDGYTVQALVADQGGVTAGHVLVGVGRRDEFPSAYLVLCPVNGTIDDLVADLRAARDLAALYHPQDAA